MNIPISVKDILRINSTVRDCWKRNINTVEPMDEESFIQLHVSVFSRMFGVSAMFMEDLLRDCFEIMKQDQKISILPTEHR